MSCLTSIVTGTILASNFFSESVFYLLVLITLSYPVLVISFSSRGPILALLVISFNIGKPSPPGKKKITPPLTNS